MAAGDKVQLITGGPIMVVASVTDGQVMCWYWGVSGSQYCAFQRVEIPQVCLRTVR